MKTQRLTAYSVAELAINDVEITTTQPRIHSRNQHLKKTI